MRESVKTVLHFAFWLFFPLSLLFSQWSSEFGIFSQIIEDSNISFWSVFESCFQFLIEPPDKCANFYAVSNMIAIIFNFYLYVILPLAIFYTSYFLVEINYSSNGSLKFKFGKVLLLLLVPIGITTIFRFLTIRVAFEYSYFMTLTFVSTIQFAFLGMVFKMAENWIAREMKESIGASTP